MSELPAIVSLTPAQQQGWVTVGQYKFDLAQRQNQKALELQQILLNAGATITEIETALANYRKVHTQMVEDGQEFRKLINDKVLQTSLTTEKEWNWKVNEDYLKKEKVLLDLKLKANDDAKAVQAKQQEKLNYAAHIKNEFLTVANELRQKAYTEINTMYVLWLKEKLQQPDIEAVKATIRGLLVPRAYIKFNKQYLTPEEATEIIKTIPSPNYAAIREEMVLLVDEKFASYAHDLAANTVDQVEQQANEEVASIAKETAIGVGINTMSAQAAVPQIVVEGKKIKKTVEVVIEGTKTWAMHVALEFWKNPLIADNVTVKNWENLTIKQMAKALGDWSTESREMSANLQYREVVK